MAAHFKITKATRLRTVQQLEQIAVFARPGPKRSWISDLDHWPRLDHAACFGDQADCSDPVSPHPCCPKPAPVIPHTPLAAFVHLSLVAGGGACVLADTVVDLMVVTGAAGEEHEPHQ